MNVTYQTEGALTVEEFRELLVESTLGLRRPVEERDRLDLMLRHANLIVTARAGEKLVGVSRALSDFTFCTYLSDLAVHKDYQRKGIGRELIKQTKLLAPQAKLILLSAPSAVGYYPAIGMTRHEHCYFLDDVVDLR